MKNGSKTSTNTDHDAGQGNSQSWVIKYYGFDPCVDDNVVFGIEKMHEVIDDLAPLHAEHFKETEVLYLNETDVLPDYERFKQVTEAGQFIVFTVRVDGKAVGYLQYYIYHDMHTRGVRQAREDAFFITKEHRGNGFAPRLLNYAESCLKKLGCDYVGMTSKGPVGGPDIGKFLERHGYKPVAMYYAKPLE